MWPSMPVKGILFISLQNSPRRATGKPFKVCERWEILRARTDRSVEFFSCRIFGNVGIIHRQKFYNSIETLAVIGVHLIRN